MACYFSVARITWAGRCRGGLLPSASSSLPLFSSFQRTHQHAGHRLRLPLNLRYKSTNNVDSTIKSKGYKFMTKSRTGIGSFASLCSHAASICTVFAYCNTDMFELRCLAISSGVLAMSFQYFRPQPLWIPIRWGCLILCINGCMITQLLIERHRANHMPPELKKIYDEGSFDERGFSKVQFMKFFKHARRTVFVGKEIISEEGREMNKLYYILDGNATVTCKTDGRKLATIPPHCFIGELSFLLHVQDHKRNEQKQIPLKKASADVVAENKTIHVLEWEFDELRKIMSADRDLSNAFAIYSSHDMRNKLLSANTEGRRT
ncbi:hypothetical protein QTG54_005938 [Skeletonema marinoi]|uniref:Cyclic nucleotide-binding domain-containing protein n=1 Tax=Skeletonema marinoi TaxID=267567 RepID=A0AAD8YD83_9STRA|nr:hypothetical protein QTG54_005938 [Skeletonema marinoi]